MSATATASETLRVVLAGNPNTGKTTVFNALTGYRSRVGNYAGVTVERKSGPLKNSRDRKVEIVDLPGTYSLSARSADEMIATEVLLSLRPEEPKIDLVLVVLDASNLERNLFLATQVQECGVPCAFILNMSDVARDNGFTVDREALSNKFGVPVFEMVASRGEGVDEVRAYIVGYDMVEPTIAGVQFPSELETEIDRLAESKEFGGELSKEARRFLIRRSLLETQGMAEKRLAEEDGGSFQKALDDSRKALAEKGIKLLTLEARVRYGYIRESLEGILSRPTERRVTLSDKLDRILIHPVLGTAIFAFMMLIVFQAIYSWSGPFMDMIDGGFGWLGELVGGAMSEGPLQSFLVDGVIAGVGGVVIFLPQIIFLFLFIALLEDCGYMARAAFLMDRLLSRAGLSGRSFIPMLSSFACAIPGIMATRTIEDRRDRMTTILVAPLMSCSARLPVYTLLIGAFIPEMKIVGFIGLQGLTLFAMYLVGVLVAIPVAWILKKYVFGGAAPTFIMELPPYRQPNWKSVVWRLTERAGAFLKRAGTIILAVSIIVWAATYYPRPASISEEIEAEYAVMIENASSEEEAAELEAARDRTIDGAYLRQSILGRMGHAMEPVVRPLGWDWKIGMATLASFPAREVIVSTLGIIYDLGSDTDEESVDLRDKLRQAKYSDGSPVFTIPVALSIMVFFALCAQCAATLAIIRRETNSWRWPVFSFAYMTVMAYVAALVTYQVARLFFSGGV